MMELKADVACRGGAAAETQYVIKTALANNHVDSPTFEVAPTTTSQTLLPSLSDRQSKQMTASSYILDHTRYLIERNNFITDTWWA